MYGSIAGWRAYNNERGITEPVVEESSLPALVRASDYIKYHYVANFRSGYDENVPEVELAAYEAANIEAVTPNFFTKTYEPAKAKVLLAVESLRWEKVAQGRTNELDQNHMVPISTKIETYLRRYMAFNHLTGLRSIGTVK